MSWIVRKPFVAAFYGTSLTTGRLSTFWVEQLAQELRGVPEALGQVILYNLGKGSQTSDWGAANAYTVAQLRPDFVLSEDFTINDCFETLGVPAVSEAQQETNMQAMHDAWVAANPDVDITWQSMSPVSTAVAVGRPTLAARYANGLLKAAAMGDRVLDNYTGGDGLPIPPGTVGGWVKPLPPHLSIPTVPFLVPQTPGFLSMETATWNPADKDADITLSGDLLTITTTTAPGIPAAVRATEAFTGLRHVEVTPTYANQINVFGVGNLAASLAGFVGGSADSLGMRGNGDVYRNGALVGPAGFIPATGTPWALEVDTPNRLVYFLQGQFRSVGFDVSAIAGDLYPMASLAAPGNSFVANFTQLGDGLHPNPDAVGLYLKPNTKFWCRQRMAELYGLPAPTP